MSKEVSIITFDALMSALFENVVRLARSYEGLNIEKHLQSQNSKYKIACAILRWNNRNPQKCSQERMSCWESRF